MSKGEFNLPPGVSSRDIPGNEPSNAEMIAEKIFNAWCADPSRPLLEFYRDWANKYYWYWNENGDRVADQLNVAEWLLGLTVAENIPALFKDV